MPNFPNTDPHFMLHAEYYRYVYECVTFSGKRKKGENDKKMITLNDNINDNTHPVQEKMITPNDNINDNTLK